MGYELHPRNKKLDVFRVGSFSWSWLLDSGVGLAIGTGPGLMPSTHHFRPDTKGRSPYCCDGFRVTDKEAKMMGCLAKEVVTLCRVRQEAFDELSKECREALHQYGSMATYSMPIRKDFVDLAERFSKWAKKSGGFSIK